MEFTAQQIADFIKGTVEGDPSVKVNNFSKIEEGKPGTLSFLSNPKYSHYIYDSNASIILVNKDFEPERSIKATLIRVENAYESLAFLMSVVERAKPAKTGISSLASIHSTATISENVYIEAFVNISEGVKIGKNVQIFASTNVGENVTIGDNVILYAGVSIYKDCVIGANCILHSGVVIGSDGFGFAPAEDGTYKKIPQMGNVVLEEDVEIGANTTVDRATMGSTMIRRGVKLDNLIQVAHNVEIGENTVMASQSGVSGSSKIGKHCMIGGQVGFAGHIHIADSTIIGAQSGVPNSIKDPGQMFMGYPAIPLKTFHRAAIVQKNLPDLQRTVYELQRKLQEMEKRLNDK
ncbi:MAG: UDP-3-O-(3-hydroxymyristoyl)glucosamine N-acyltransferase [Paludibacter sp.]|nr:UDP-3-O-(3-hydroxymyristoyl)glucosamine N-acyltransferase [Paludibacter sp.]